MAPYRRRWLVTGAGGMLGTDLCDVLTERGDEAIALARSHLDITDTDAVAELPRNVDVIVNCSAYTAVDDAESDEDAALAVNAIGARNLALATIASDARMVQISTDYVFDGVATTPYVESAPLSPKSAYGRTKAAGEIAVRDSGADALIVRTAWLYGANGGCFPKTIARLARSKPELSVVNDQVGQPTWTRDLAEFIVRLIDSDAPRGTYHGTATGETTWFDFAGAVVASAGAQTLVRPTTSEAFARPAVRPSYSVLGHDAAEAIGVASIGSWRDRWELAADEVLAGT